MDEFESVLLDDELLRRNANGEDFGDQKACWTEIFKRLDPTADGASFRDFALQCSNGSADSPPDLSLSGHSRGDLHRRRTRGTGRCRGREEG
jgi:hypothetical protein